MQQVIHAAADGPASDDLVPLPDRVFEDAKAAGLMAFQFDDYKNDNMRRHLSKVELRLVTLYQSGTFQPLQAFPAGRGGQVHTFGKLSLGNTPLCREDAQDLDVTGIELQGHKFN